MNSPHMDLPYSGFGFTDGFPLIPTLILPLFIMLIVWSVAIKGYALWTAARRGEKWWFISIMLLNTIGLLEVFYLLVIVHKKLAFLSKKVPPVDTEAK